MNYINEKERNERKSLLLMLYKMAKEDERNHVHEDRFIRDVAEKFGLSEEDLDDVKYNPSNIQFTLPKYEHERMHHFQHILTIVKIDGSVTADEKELCKRMGFRLGLRPQLVDELVNLFEEYIDKGIPTSQLKEVIQKFMN